MSKKKKKSALSDALPRNVLGAAPLPPSLTDPQGSWTGKPENPWETPVQDADDL